MKLFQFIRKSKSKIVKRSFADFLLNASDKEKKRVFTHAAQKANKDQSDLVAQSR